MVVMALVPTPLMAIVMLLLNKMIIIIEADEATALSDFLKMENEIKGKKHREKEREREGMRRRTESQLQIVLIINHDTLRYFRLGRLLCVFVFFVLLGFVGKCHFHLRRTGSYMS
jgi:hypothetical protein